MTKADPSSPGDTPQSTVEELRSCSVQITCPPVVPHPGAPLTKVMLPNFRATGTYACDQSQALLRFLLTRNNKTYTAPDLAVLCPGGPWAASGWTEFPFGGPPPDGAGYKLTVILLVFNNNTWVPCATAECDGITISANQGSTCP